MRRPIPRNAPDGRARKSRASIAVAVAPIVSRLFAMGVTLLGLWIRVQAYCESPVRKRKPQDQHSPNEHSKALEDLCDRAVYEWRPASREMRPAESGLGICRRIAHRHGLNRPERQTRQLKVAMSTDLFGIPGRFAVPRVFNQIYQQEPGAAGARG